MSAILFQLRNSAGGMCGRSSAGFAPEGDSSVLTILLVAAWLEGDSEDVLPEYILELLVVATRAQVVGVLSSKFDRNDDVQAVVVRCRRVFCMYSSCAEQRNVKKSKSKTNKSIA